MSLAGAFNNCENLTKIIIPGSVYAIASSFVDCPLLMDIYYEGTIEEWEKIKPKNLEGTTMVHCKDGDIQLGSQ